MSQGVILCQRGIPEATALKLVLDLCAGLVAGHLPAVLGQHLLLAGVDRQARTRQRELQQEDQEQNDHVLGNDVQEQPNMPSSTSFCSFNKLS